MKSLLGGVWLLGALNIAAAFPLGKNITQHEMDRQEPVIPGLPDRCDGLGFDAITLDEQGVTNYFKDGWVWAGHRGPARPISGAWAQVPTPFDAAFRLHRTSGDRHDHVFIFKGERVWQFHGAVSVGNFLIRDLFPGVPDAPDGAVECPKGDCAEDSVLIIKGDTMYTLDLSTNTVKSRQWEAVRDCTALSRWLDRYYCFQGTLFTRFHPVTGAVEPVYPKDARDYFMVCPGRGHASRNSSIDRRVFSRCSDVPYDAFDHDALGRMYAFRGDWYFRVDAQRDGWHPWPLSSSWPGLHGPVDAVFSWDNKMYFIKGQQLFIYKAVARYNLIHGYPRPLSDELGITGTVDAAFICPGSSLLHLITGNQMRAVNLDESPRMPQLVTRIPQLRLDGAMCDGDGVWLVAGGRFYRYPSPAAITAPDSSPTTGSVTERFMGCGN